MDPPKRAVLFSFDEKTRWSQALDRTQPSLPMGPGRVGTNDPHLRRWSRCESAWCDAP